MATLSEGTVGRMEREVLLDLQEDYVGAWEIARVVEDELETTDYELVREGIARIISEMLSRGLIRAGLAKNDGGFDPWPLDSGQVEAKIRERLNALDRAPNIGEVGWFGLTDYGEQVSAQEV